MNEKKYIDILLVDEKTGKIISKAYNKRESSFKTLNHAEIICISKANKRMRSKILDKCILYVTLQPCDMCKTVIKEARIKKVYYLLERNIDKKQYFKTEFNKWVINKQYEDEYRKLLTFFFKKKR